MDRPGSFTERRAHPRAIYPTLLRPQLRLPFGTHPVLDASQAGIRLLYTTPVLPKVGSRIQGGLEFPYGEAPLQVSGTVVRVERNEVGVDFGRRTIPPGFLPPTT